MLRVRGMVRSSFHGDLTFKNGQNIRDKPRPNHPWGHFMLETIALPRAVP